MTIEKQRRLVETALASTRSGKLRWTESRGMPPSLVTVLGGDQALRLIRFSDEHIELQLLSGEATVASVSNKGAERCPSPTDTQAAIDLVHLWDEALAQTQLPPADEEIEKALEYMTS